MNGSLGLPTAGASIALERRTAGSVVTSHRKGRGPIRVVDVCNVSSSANTMLKNRVLAMRAQGIDNRILCIDGPYVRVLEEAGIPVQTVHVPRGFDLINVVRSFVEIFTYLKREKIDLIHTHFSVPGFVGRLAARLAGVPVMVHTIHGLPYHAKSPWAQRTFYILLERLVGGLADVVLSQNRGDIDDAVRYAIIPRDRLRYIGNGIRLDRFRPVRRDTPPHGLFTITCTARMELVKNHPMLFEALRILKERGHRFRVQLVGEGELMSEHQALCQRLGIADRVEFLGYRDDVPEILAQTDISVLTSIKEGVPRAMMESMAMALPTVATRIAGNVDVVRDGETGFLVDVDDCVGLADRLERLMADPALRARMGARGREVVLQEFDEDRIIESLGHVYRTLLLKKGIAAPASVPQTVNS
jgi:glycosyltransferase involved in cell wall biosynthesis